MNFNLLKRLSPIGGLVISGWTPQNFTGTLYDPDGVDQQDAILTWTAKAGWETEIWRSLDGGAFALLTTIAPEIGTYTDALIDGYAHDVDYYLRGKQDTTVLSAPTGFTAVEDATGVQLDCNVIADAEYYEWWGSINGAATVLIATTATNTYHHAISKGNTVIYKIRGKEGTLPVYSSFSSEITVNLQLVDQDGNVYTTVVIGTQTWMVENWKSTKFNDGDTIPICVDAAALAACVAEGASAVYMSWLAGNVANKALYGGLYTHAAIRSAKGFCPAGWHIPTTAEITTLSNYLGGAAVSGGHLKADGTTYWNSDNADNSSGFDARGGGRATTVWSAAKANGYYWAYGYSGNYSEHIAFQTGDTILTFVSQLNRQYQMSIRLIKD